MKPSQTFRGALCFALLIGLIVCSAPLGAQPTGQNLTALTLERTIALNNVLSGPVTPNIPATLLAALASGALELREQVNFNAQVNTLTATFFVVAPGSPTPTNLGRVNAGTIVAVVTLNVDKVYVSPKPASVTIVGTISATSSPFGAYTAVPAVFSFGYTSDTPPKIINVVELVAGTAVVFSPAGTGTFTLTALPGSGGGGGGTTPITITVSGPGASTGTANSFQTAVSTFVLDASKSTSTNAGALTYAWAALPGYPPASIAGGNTATPTITVTSKSNYGFTVTVTDSTGTTATATITVQFI
jgi:K319-like protein